MNLKKVLACTLICSSIITTANAVTAHSAPIRNYAKDYAVTVTWDKGTNRIVIGGEHFTIKETCDKVENGTCMISKENFHKFLDDHKIKHYIVGKFNIKRKCPNYKY